MNAKRKPGRPKKTITNINIALEGIVDEPMNKDFPPAARHVIEVIYGNPMLFKKLIVLFKQMAVEEILMKFEQKRVVMIAKDHKRVSTIHVDIDGNKLHRYYCREPVTIGLGAKYLQQVIQTIDKDTSTICILIPQDMLHSKIQIVLRKPHLDNDKIYDLDVIQAPNFAEDLEGELADLAEYPVHFEIPAKIFKKDMNDYATLTEELHIEKRGDEPLRYRYKSKDNRVCHVSIYSKAESINLQSTVAHDAFFTVAFEVEFVKPFANALIADTIQISAHPTKRLVFTCTLDEEGERQKKVCTVYVLTEIKRHNG